MAHTTAAAEPCPVSLPHHSGANTYHAGKSHVLMVSNPLEQQCVRGRSNREAKDTTERVGSGCYPFKRN